MFPKKIQSYINIKDEKDGENNLSEGKLECCNTQCFEVFIVGKLRCSVLTGIYLYPEDDRIAIQVRCKKCSKIISVFDNSQDGYEKHNKNLKVKILPKVFYCSKCHESNFEIKIKYEYPKKQELEELGIKEIDNTFTWVYITLKCKTCGKKYGNFISYETD